MSFPTTSMSGDSRLGEGKDTGTTMLRCVSSLSENILILDGNFFKYVNDTCKDQSTIWMGDGENEVFTTMENKIGLLRVVMVDIAFELG